MLRAFLAAVLFAVSAGLLHAAAPPRAADEIEHLLKYVRQLEGATFIRNGDEHSCQEAESHLRLKWSRQTSSITSAERFIDLCATKSSLSGKRYQIRFSDGTVRNAADVLAKELRQLRSDSRSS
jgi:hypothetical protein